MPFYDYLVGCSYQKLFVSSGFFEAYEFFILFKLYSQLSFSLLVITGKASIHAFNTVKLLCITQVNHGHKYIHLREEHMDADMDYSQNLICF